MAPRRKAQAPIRRRRILQRIPEPDRRRRIRIQERRILVRRHGAPDLRLLADDHRLEHARVAEAQGARDGRVARGERYRGEGRREGVQGVAYFVDGEVFGFGEDALGVDRVYRYINMEISTGGGGALFLEWDCVYLWVGGVCDLPSSKKNRTLSPLVRK